MFSFSMMSFTTLIPVPDRPFLRFYFCYFNVLIEFSVECVHYLVALFCFYACEAVEWGAYVWNGGELSWKIHEMLRWKLKKPDVLMSPKVCRHTVKLAFNRLFSKLWTKFSVEIDLKEFKGPHFISKSQRGEDLTTERGSDEGDMSGVVLLLHLHSCGHKWKKKMSGQKSLSSYVSFS